MQYNTFLQIFSTKLRKISFGAGQNMLQLPRKCICVTCDTFNSLTIKNMVLTIFYIIVI